MKQMKTLECPLNPQISSEISHQAKNSDNRPEGIVCSSISSDRKLHKVQGGNKLYAPVSVLKVSHSNHHKNSQYIYIYI